MPTHKLRKKLRSHAKPTGPGPCHAACTNVEVISEDDIALKLNFSTFLYDAALANAQIEEKETGILSVDKL